MGDYDIDGKYNPQLASPVSDDYVEPPTPGPDNEPKPQVITETYVKGLEARIEALERAICIYASEELTGDWENDSEVVDWFLNL